MIKKLSRLALLPFIGFVAQSAGAIPEDLSLRNLYGIESVFNTSDFNHVLMAAFDDFNERRFISNRISINSVIDFAKKIHALIERDVLPPQGILLRVAGEINWQSRKFTAAEDFSADYPHKILRATRQQQERLIRAGNRLFIDAARIAKTPEEYIRVLLYPIAGDDYGPLFFEEWLSDCVYDKDGKLIYEHRFGQPLGEMFITLFARIKTMTAGSGEKAENKIGKILRIISQNSQKKNRPSLAISKSIHDSLEQLRRDIHEFPSYYDIYSKRPQRDVENFLRTLLLQSALRRHCIHWFDVIFGS
jgi:hypothetical protein